MPRVLSISTLYPSLSRPQFGGFVARQMEALAKRGDWRVTVINPIGLPPLALGRYAAQAAAAVDSIDNGVEVHRPRFTLIPGLGARWNPGAIVRAVLPLARRLHDESPFDLVDAQFFWPDGPAAAAIAGELGLPLSLKARGSDIHHWGARGFARRRMVAAARQAAGILAVSQALRHDMIALGMPGERITVHHTGLDRERFHLGDRSESRAALERSHGVPADGKLLASVGALIPVKGQAHAIRGLTLLSEDVRLALAGTGPDLPKLAALALKQGVSRRVHFLGAVPHGDLPMLLAAADAMVLPSAREGLANAWIEALACGTPIVIPDVGGAREVVTAPAAGLIVPREPGAIAAAVAALLADPPAPPAVAATVAGFSWEANAAALAAHYAGIASGPA